MEKARKKTRKQRLQGEKESRAQTTHVVTVSKAGKPSVLEEFRVSKARVHARKGMGGVFAVSTVGIGRLEDATIGVGVFDHSVERLKDDTWVLDDNWVLDDPDRRYTTHRPPFWVPARLANADWKQRIFAIVTDNGEKLDALMEIARAGEEDAEEPPQALLDAISTYDDSLDAARSAVQTAIESLESDL